MEHGGTTASVGALNLRIVRAGERFPASIWPTHPLTLAEMERYAAPQRGLLAEVNDWRRRNVRRVARAVPKILIARGLKIPHFYGSLFLTVFRAEGERLDLGLASLKLVTTVGVKYICDDIAGGASDVNLFKFHGIGTGGAGEAVGDSALVTEITTAYNPDNTRATGNQASATVTTNATYTTVGTVSVDGPVANTEHGIFTQAATGGGTLLDRSLYTVVNLASGDSLQATYVLTLNSGG